jgi:hypothetical protein
MALHLPPDRSPAAPRRYLALLNKACDGGPRRAYFGARRGLVDYNLNSIYNVRDYLTYVGRRNVLFRSGGTFCSAKPGARVPTF